MDRRQVMITLNEALDKFTTLPHTAQGIRDYMDTRLQIIELQDKLATVQGAHAKAELDAVKHGPVLTDDDAPNHLGSVIYNLLLDNGPLKFADIMKALGKRHKLLKGVKYPQARVQAAIRRETAIERVAVGVYAAHKDSVKR